MTGNTLEITSHHVDDDCDGEISRIVERTATTLRNEGALGRVVVATHNGEPVVGVAIGSHKVDRFGEVRNVVVETDDEILAAHALRKVAQCIQTSAGVHYDGLIVDSGVPAQGIPEDVDLAEVGLTTVAFQGTTIQEMQNAISTTSI